jgi:ferredoxin-NADP reductase
VRLSSQVGNLTNVPDPRPPTWTIQEVSRHNRRDDCWMVIRNKVYDVTSYMEYHPGGPEELMRGAGSDATALFAEAHSWVNFESLLASCLLGELDPSAPDHKTGCGAESSTPVTAKETAPAASASSVEEAPPALLSDASLDWHAVSLAGRRVCSPPRADVVCEVFSFRLSDPAAWLWPPGLPAGKHVQIGMEIDSALVADSASRRLAGHVVSDSALVVREFTPVALRPGAFDLAIKLYPRGKLSRRLASLSVGSQVLVRGPRGAFSYHRGKATIQGAAELPVKELLLAGGGSGVTPALQVARHALEDPEDAAKVSILVCHSSPDSAMLLDEFTDLATRFPDRCTLTVAFSSYPGHESSLPVSVVSEGVPRVVRGRVGRELLDMAWPKPHADQAIAWSGPPGFNDAVDVTARACYFLASRMHVF